MKFNKDDNWKKVAERAKSLLERLMLIQPHVSQLDAFYGFLMRFVYEVEDLENTGYFEGKDGMYKPINTP